MAAAGRRRTKIAGQFTARTIAMVESPAFRVLSLGAHRALARIEIEHAHHGGADNGRLPVTFGQFVEYGMDRHSIAPALRELEALGFIEMTERGRAGNGEHRRASMFRLTYRPTPAGGPTDDWRHVVDEADARARKTERQCGKAHRTGGGKRIE